MTDRILLSISKDVFFCLERKLLAAATSKFPLFLFKNSNNLLAITYSSASCSISQTIFSFLPSVIFLSSIIGAMIDIINPFLLEWLANKLAILDLFKQFIDPKVLIIKWFWHVSSYWMSKSLIWKISLISFSVVKMVMSRFGSSLVMMNLLDKPSLPSLRMILN